MIDVFYSVETLAIDINELSFNWRNCQVFAMFHIYLHPLKESAFFLSDTRRTEGYNKTVTRTLLVRSQLLGCEVTPGITIDIYYMVTRRYAL